MCSWFFVLLGFVHSRSDQEIIEITPAFYAKDFGKRCLLLATV